MLKSRITKPTAEFAYVVWYVWNPPWVDSGLRWCSLGQRFPWSPPVCSAEVCLICAPLVSEFRSCLECLQLWHDSPLLSSLSAVTNKHHFADGPLLYQFRMNFRRRRRLIELLHERGRGIPESHDSPFCLRKQNSDGGNTSFLSGRSTFRQDIPQV